MIFILFVILINLYISKVIILYYLNDKFFLIFFEG
jgi:hypothetical protein